jgi:uncharacterized protein
LGFENAFPIETRKSGIEGRGVFAAAAIPARRKIGEFTGERISQSEARRRARTLKHIKIVELNDRTAIDGTSGESEFSFINHSCSPNTFMRICGGRVEFYSLRPIARGEELTCDYKESHHEGKLPCRCGTSKCRGFI